MQISKYFYEVGSIKKKSRFELLQERNTYMTNDYIKKFGSQIKEIELDGTVAVLYAGGVSVHQGESREYLGCRSDYNVPINKSGMVVREISAYMMHKYIGLINKNNNVVYANINSNTCASSMHSIYEAQRLLDGNEVDNVIIITEEKTSLNTVRIFKEHNIELMCGEGFALMVLNRDTGSQKAGTITDAKWAYEYNNNPFLVTADGYRQVDTDGCDMVKGHQTGTTVNDMAEMEAFGSQKIIGYKKKTGHTQGASALIEICMLLEDSEINNGSRVLCTASGLGGYYGSCVVNKV